jgi:hypothetical protein
MPSMTVGPRIDLDGSPIQGVGDSLEIVGPSWRAEVSVDQLIEFFRKWLHSAFPPAMDIMTTQGTTAECRPGRRKRQPCPA